MDNSLKIFEEKIKGNKRRYYDYKDNISSSGDFSRIEGLYVLINSLRNLLLTPLGSYPFKPNYGSKLYKMVWEPLDSISLETITYEVKDRVYLFDRRIKIKSVQVTPSFDKKCVIVTVFLEYKQEEANVKIDFSNLPELGLQ